VAAAVHIHFACSGGFANLPLAYRANTDELPEEEARRLFQLLDEAEVFDLDPLPPKDPSPLRDGFAYRLEVERDNQRADLSLSDATAPPSLRPLLNHLRGLAAQQLKTLE
jgi:hypothetical protein